MRSQAASTGEDTAGALRSRYGVFLVGRSPGVIGSTVDAPGYVRWDGFAAYHFNLGGSRLTAQVNVNNILDKGIFLCQPIFLL